MTAVARVGDRLVPLPTSPRAKPLRLGICNIWEYDDQEFWPADGRLILRGHNTAGKSKALELLLPFVLDGETRPERLDPFGGQSKTMYWNLIDFDPERNVAVGYSWVELGYLDDLGEARYVTVIVGMRGQRSSGRKVDTWFAVTPQRVGVDLDLAPDGTPLIAARLREALAPDAVFTTTAREHRAAVDAALFGLGVDRYEALIHLLLQLRRPKLSEKLDLVRLGGILTDALPPVERRHVEALAEAFTKLDAQRERVEQLEAAHAAVTSFLDPYRSYARVHCRLRADGVRAANAALDKVTETERAQRAELAAAEEQLAAVESRRGELRHERTTSQGALDALDLTKVAQLAEVQDKAAALERNADDAAARSHDDAQAVREAQRRATESSERAAQAVAERDRHATDAAALADAAGVGGEHAATVGSLDTTDVDAGWERAVDGADAAATRRTGVVHEVRAADRAAAQVRQRLEREQGRLADAESRRDEADHERSVAEQAAEHAASAFVDALDEWAEELDGAVADRVLDAGTDLAARARTEVLVADDLQPARDALVRSLIEPVRASFDDERAELTAERRAVLDRRSALATERDRVAAEQEDGPSPTPGRPAERPDGAVPLWACTDFADDLGDGQRAGLEAALAAAGLLDALVAPDGRLLTADGQLVDGAVDGPGDTVVAAGGPHLEARPESHLGRWLRPAPDPSSPVAAEAVAAALAVVGAGPGPSACWVATDGSWANGPLRGRWRQDAARHIGAATRAAARARRLAALDEALAEVAAELEALDGRLAVLAERRAALEVAAGAFPAISAVRDARRDLAAATAALGRAADAVTAAAEQVAQVRAEAADALAALDTAVAAAGCAPEAVDATLTALGDYRRALAGLRAEATRAASEQRRARRDAADVADAGERADRSAALHQRAADDAARARAEADQLEAIIGVEVAAVLARRDVLLTRLAEIEVLDEALVGERDTLLGRVGAARQALDATAGQRATRDAERADALERLHRLAATELVRLAVDGIEPDGDLRQVTAGLGFARKVHELLRGVETDQAAQDRAADRLHRGYQQLRSALGAAYDPNLDTHDGVSLCFTTLNGQVAGTLELADLLGAEAERSRRMLTAEERDAIERHLLTEVGTHLSERVHDAWALVDRMNGQLAAHPTRSGVSLRLRWEPGPDAGPGADVALALLRRGVAMLTDDERATLTGFLNAKIDEARADDTAADVVERLVEALDYRRWHRFVLFRRSGSGEERLTNRSQATGSGGEQAKLAHLPLFAATAAYYESARPTAPHLLLLDEAFAGIDRAQRGDIMGMLVDLDLDLICTNYDEWGMYAEVPAVATYHLERTPGRLGVAALRFVWDGVDKREDDPFLASAVLAANARSVAADEGSLFGADADTDTDDGA